MNISQISQILSANDASDVTPQSPVSMALGEVNIYNGDKNTKDLVKGQERLLASMEEIKKATGASPSLIRSADLGEVASRTSGELSPTELRKILATEDGRKLSGWSFKQGENGAIVAVEHATHVPGETLTRAQVASAVARRFEYDYGTKILEKTLENTARLAAASVRPIDAENAWKTGQSVASDKSSVLAQEARYSVAQALKSGELVPEGAESAAKRKAAEAASVAWSKSILADAGENAALKAGAKIAGKAIPVAGLGLVGKDAWSAGADMVDSAKQGQYKNAAIDGTRAVAGLVLGVGEQFANVTVVGGLAVGSAAASLEYGLKKLKDPSLSQETEIMKAAYVNAIHNPDALKQDQNLIQYLKDKPELNIAIDVYARTEKSFGYPANGLNNEQLTILSNIETKTMNAIDQGRLSPLNKVVEPSPPFNQQLSQPMQPELALRR